MIHTKHVFYLKKYLENYPSPWKFFLNERLLSVGGKFVLDCNLEITKLTVTLLFFYKQCFDAWFDLSNKIPLSFQEIVNEIIWNNKFLFQLTTFYPINLQFLLHKLNSFQVKPERNVLRL